MDDDVDQKTGKLKVLQGGLCDKRRRLRSRRTQTRAEMELDRRMQTAFALVTDPRGNVPDKRTYRIREREGFPWRVLGRSLVDFHRRRVRKEHGDSIIAAIRQWHDDLHAGRLDTNSDFQGAA